MKINIENLGKFVNKLQSCACVVDTLDGLSTDLGIVKKFVKLTIDFATSIDRLANYYRYKASWICYATDGDQSFDYDCLPINHIVNVDEYLLDWAMELNNFESDELNKIKDANIENPIKSDDDFNDEYNRALGIKSKMEELWEYDEGTFNIINMFLCDNYPFDESFGDLDIIV